MTHSPGHTSASAQAESGGSIRSDLMTPYFGSTHPPYSA